MLKIINTSLLFLSFFTTLLGYSSTDPIQLYKQGAYEESAQIFESMITPQNQNASVLYNLGKIYEKQGDDVKALAAFLKAERLAPRSSEVDDALEAIRSKLKSPLPLPRLKGVSSIVTAYEFISLKELFWMAVTICTLGSLLLIIGIYRQWQLLGPTCAFIVGLFISGLFLFRYLEEPQIAVVQETELKVLASPQEEGGVSVFSLSKGNPVQFLEAKGEWSFIQLTDRRQGWVKSSQLKMY